MNPFNSYRPHRQSGLARKWLLILAGIVAIAVLLAGLLFNKSTREALNRAESMQFRRMQVSQLEGELAYRFFFATNRELPQTAEPLERRFTSDRSSRLTLGSFDTAIEPSLGIGMLVNPTDWFQNEEIQVLDIRTHGEDEFVDQVRAQVERSPYRSLLININGFRERFPSALRKTAFLAHVLDVDAPIMVFDWPGDQGSTPRGYRAAQAVARDSAQELAGTIRLAIERIKPTRIWVLANSMGAEVVVQAMMELNAVPHFADSDTEIEHVILTAPDVDHAAFGLQFRPVIESLSRYLTVYVSSNDRALLMSRVLNRGRRLGESTFDTRNPDMTDEAERAFGLVRPADDTVSLVDITPVNRTRNFHNFSLETPEFFDDIYLRLTNEEAPRSRRKYRIETSGGRAYWVLTGGQ